MQGDYAVIIDGELHTYTDSNDVPLVFDRLVRCVPTPPPPPHTDEQHKEIENLHRLLERMMRMEKNASSCTYRRPRNPALLRNGSRPGQR